MTVRTPYVEFAVGAADAVSLARLAGWTLTAVSDRVWLTEENGGRDVWLLPGERHIIAGAGRVVVEPWTEKSCEATRAATIRLLPPAGACWRGWRLPGFRLRSQAAACA
ncbi:MAG TPA: DUF2917 domain-containing protein [Candidatus Accumulibacter phosphatis]|nr:MAG: hypothetical protein AW07_04383 [Candidatus Accumulibacter sp. SK-11]HRL78102.1 DUF2917 domain-containing protein [Candidatus Accumulibacter phosphatis]HRQ96874.1 DUF2917 domain-containing protein [Candidatus Accumulibacter phosphatis]